MTCCCNRKSSALKRREFLKLVGLAVAGATASGVGVMAGPFEAGDFKCCAPVDKKLSEAWLRSLIQRGQPEIYEGAALKTIGMPVGGVACGQIYLGGDGHLWKWDIFRASGPFNYNSPNYSKPPSSDSKIKQGFAVSVNQGAETKVHPLSSGGFEKITFRGEYPVARVNYSDSKIPLSVTLEAYTPFIPLNLDDSSYPATVFSYRLKNTGTQMLHVTLAGWLMNAVQPEIHDASVTRCFEVKHGKGCLSLSGSSQKGNPIVTTDVPVANSVQQAKGDGKKPPVRKPQAPPPADRGIGTMSLNLLNDEGMSLATADAGTAESPSDVLARLTAKNAPATASRPGSENLIGALGRSLTLKPGQEKDVTFVMAWHFPSYEGFQTRIKDRGQDKRYYAKRFNVSTDVAEHIAANIGRLAGDTMLWNKTWYDSSLPYWFLDRTFLTIDTLASQTVHRFDSGRIWAWEGVNCCPGTCQHVWQYAQGAARIFPEFERSLRESVDFGIAWKPDGAMAHRAEFGQEVFMDGFLGTILRTYREHQTSKDDAYLKRIWPKVRKSIEYAMSQPGGDQGVLTGSQRNTLDAEWAGSIAWISSLYISALRAGQAMAVEMGDAEFAEKCSRIAELGSRRLIETLYNGEYLIHIPDPEKPKLTNSNIGCHIDQTMGQAFAFQLGLPRIIPKKESISCLESIWKYNFTPDCGGYRKESKIPDGRWYAMAGEAGVLMTTFPKGGADRAKGTKGCPKYFNEVWSGQEHQVAGHMIAEGLVEKGLAVIRSIHDRHNAKIRNPYNEVECEDHYSRAMSSYGAYLAACGFEYHGPKGHIGFMPKLKPEDFKAAFTAAEGWGSYSQKIDGGKLNAEIVVRWGKLSLKTIALQDSHGKPTVTLVSRSGRRTIPATASTANGRMLVSFAKSEILMAGDSLLINA